MPQNRKRRAGKSRRAPRSASVTRPATKQKQSTSRITTIIWVFVIVAVLAGATYYFTRGRNAKGGEITTASGLKYVDLVEGAGASPKAGQTIKVEYTGSLANGTVFESPARHGGPQEFVIGKGAVIKGWDEGIMTMKIGGKRKLIIPPSLGYGPAGRPPAIPPNSILNFDIELIGVK